MLEVGSVLDGKYKILNEVGRGGMSVVYLARNERANKNWAVKEVRKNGTTNNDVVKQNLITETNILKKLHNPHLPSIVDVIDREDAFVIVMDYVEGNDLGQILKRNGAQSEEKVVNWGKQLCNVLAYLHSQDPPIIYRDMKPSNVRLRPDGMIMLLDFGTAREYKSQKAGDDTTCLGTRGYAAPEQYGGQGQTDARTDIYCLGATLYHLVTGHNPGMPPYEMKPIRQINPALSDGLEEIILKCTRPNPDERYQSCAELWYDLEHLKELGQKARSTRTVKLVSWGSSIAIGILGLVSAFAFNNAEIQAKASDYDEQIAAAKTETDMDKAQELEKKKERYLAAVAIEPTRADAYNDFLNYLIEDGNFSAEEVSAMLEVLGHSTNDRAKTAEVEFAAGNSKDYYDFEYNLGLSYFFYYEGGNGTDNGIRRKAKECFEKASSEESSIEDKEFAQVLYNVADFTVEGIRKKTDEDVRNMFDSLNTVIEKMQGETSLTSMYELQIYRYAVNAVGNYLSDFANAGIDKGQLEGLLDEVETLLDTNEAVLRADGQNDGLIDAIRKNMESVRKNISLKYK